MTFRFFTTLPAALALCFCSTAQVVHVVQMGGSTISQTTPPYYSPTDLTINQGDTVRWLNVSGTHNVNGTLTTFPGNPEAFYSGMPQNGDYHFDHRFDLPGLYNYHCDSDGHAITQSGTITVEEVINSIVEPTGYAPITLHPNPVRSALFVGVGQRMITRVTILGMDGRLVENSEAKGSGLLTIGTEDLANGNYILRVEGPSGPQNIPFSKQ